jgi:maltooligosyltrehalose trehalohydrolase
MLNWYRKLIAIRKAHSELTNGSLEETQVEYREDEKWLDLRRGTIEITVNLGSHLLERRLPERATLLLASNDTTRIESSSLILPQEAVSIIKLE